MFGFYKEISYIRILYIPSFQVLRWRRADWLNFLCNRVPILQWLPAYKWKSDLIVDIIGGLMISIVCVPQGEWGHNTWNPEQLV